MAKLELKLPVIVSLLKLKITSELKLPMKDNFLPLHSFICAKNIMIIVLLLQMTGGWEGWGMVHLCLGLVEVAGGRYHIFSIFVFFVFVLNCS